MARTTMEDVAKAAGVSRALVSLAYRNANGVSDVTRERILNTGDQIGYVHNRVAASLASTKSASIGVFLQDLHNDFFADVFDGIREVADPESRQLVLAVGSRKRDRDASSLNTLAGAQVGMVIAAGLQLPDEDALAHSRRTPIIAVARHIPGVDSVYSDNVFGGQLATEHLLQLGHRKIVFLANPPTDGYLGRREGYQKSMAAAGLQPQIVQTTYGRTEASRLATELLDSAEPPTAIFAHNDQAALGVLDALAARSLQPGRDVSVIGYDNTSMSSATGTALTSIDLHALELGRDATRLALRRFENPDLEPQLITSIPSLVPRATTGPAPEQ